MIIIKYNNLVCFIFGSTIKIGFEQGLGDKTAFVLPYESEIISKNRGQCLRSVIDSTHNQKKSYMLDYFIIIG